MPAPGQTAGPDPGSAPCRPGDSGRICSSLGIRFLICRTEVMLVSSQGILGSLGQLTELLLQGLAHQRCVLSIHTRYLNSCAPHPGAVSV